MSEERDQAPVFRFIARHPRTAGIGLSLLSLVLLAWNSHAESARGGIYPEGSYYPAAYLFGYPGVLLGLVFAITGRTGYEKKQLSGRWIVSVTVALVVGVGYGLYKLRQAHGAW